MDQYDEWGNYIGDLSDDSDSESLEEKTTHAKLPSPSDFDSNPLGALPEPDDHALMEIDDIGPSQAVVLHDDKKYYPLASELYGPDVETMVEEEDAQPLSEPIINPIKVRKFTILEKGADVPQTNFSKQFMLDLMSHSESVRNVAVVGHLHHGKTALIDMLVHETHPFDWDTSKPLRYTDTHILSQQRGISLKSSSMSFVLPNSKNKSFLVNMIDTPGHVNFLDEVTNSLRLVDGAILVVDAVEGVLVTSEKIIRHLLQENIPIVLVVNKVDRLILELRLPPADAYYKLKHTIEEVNTIISSVNPDPKFRVSPELGNVGFASTEMGWCFNLTSFAKMYRDTYCQDKRDLFDIEEFGKRLWGNIWYIPEEKKFVKKNKGSGVRTFDHFILEPLYKLYGQVLGSEQAELQETLSTLGIYLKPSAYKLDVRPLLRIVLSQFFGPSTGLVDMIAAHIPDPRLSADSKLLTNYTGPLDSPIANHIRESDPKGPLIIQITKLYPTHDAGEFRSFGRVLSGVARAGVKVKVLGEGYSINDEEDMVEATIEKVSISESRYSIETSGVPAGNLCLLSGIDNSITKTATVIESSYTSPGGAGEGESLYIFKPISHLTKSILKIAVEPLNPSELPKLLEGLRKVNKTYPLVEIKVEESGEHVVIGTGEIYLDCCLFDLREIFSEIEIKVSDPVVKFCETVVDTSVIRCYAETPNKKNKLTMIAEPLERGIAEDIETGKINIRMPPKTLSQHFMGTYQWDLLSSRSIWAFGPEEEGGGTNILMNDTLPTEVDRTLLSSVKESVKQGFQWGTREGPICDEPIRNVKFRLLDATLADEPIYRGGGQIIPTARRVCYSSFMMATPRLMEPVYYIEVQAPADCVPAVYAVLARRRGHVTQDIPKPGSPLYTVKAYIPVIDANGFETDLRTHTQGQSFCLQTFDHWSIVPGDPTDKSIVLRPLEPASAQALARDMALKTRRRKGLGDNMSVAKYIEADLVSALIAAGQEDLLG
ncbi:P-loop containing nucleoside triphosphate hydrolase protein [Melampsora americana]|nr:P-loop containing nucleoside triphosphate hydrolase protein [Melampsora americana]